MGPKGALNALRDGILSLAYPSECRLCGASIQSWEDGVACDGCWSEPAITPLFVSRPLCSKCGLPVHSPSLERQLPLKERLTADGTGPSTPDPSRTPAVLRAWCGSCEALPMKVTRACGAYSGALQASVLFLKTHPHVCTRLRRILGRVFDINQEELASDLIVPVPLHRSRKKERGFNQSMVLAGAVGKIAGIPVHSGSIERMKQTKRHRAGMDLVDRARSVERAFHVTNARRIENRNLLLIDDVFTTGSTLTEAATALLDGGAATVNCLTIARVVLPWQGQGPA
jgi:ComF family protein